LNSLANDRGEDVDMPPQTARARTDHKQRLVALTNDAPLARALQELTAGGVDVCVVPDMRSLSDELLQHAGSMALLDANSLDAPVEAAVDALASHFPDLRLLVAGHGTEQSLLATRIASQKVFRFVHKPASTQRLQLFLDAAARPAESRHRPALASTPIIESAPLSRIDTAVRGKSPLTLAIVGVAVLAAIAVGAILFWPKSQRASLPQAGQVAAAVVSAPTSAEVLARIRRADAAFAASRYVGSDGSSAAEAYRDALKLDASNPVARRGYDRSIELGLRSAEDALLAGKLTDAAAAIEALRLMSPNNPRLPFLDAQVSRELARVNADASQRQALEARLGDIRQSLVQMNERLRRGALIEPTGNSAVFHFREAESLGAGETSVRNAREALVATLLTSADTELTAHRTPQARRLVDAAASINSGASGLDVLRRRLDEVATQAAASAETAAKAVAEAKAAAAAPDPAAEPAAVAQTAAPEIVAASTLVAVRTARPDYPQRALEQLVSGWVEMEFTVGPDGSVKDVFVKNSEPKRTFDSAASAAMRRYRYTPVLKDGVPVEQRARIRMRFTATESR
jgi:TonB family protein